MINKIKKSLIFLSTTLVLTLPIHCMVDKRPSKQNQAITKEEPINKALPKYIPQKLVSTNMDVLNKFLLLIPMNALRLEKAYSDAQEGIKYFAQIDQGMQDPTKALSHEEETKKVLEFRDKLLKPIANFFTNLYDHQLLLKPLIIEIFKAAKFATTDEELNNTIMVQFFNVDKKTAQTYFNDLMVTKEMFLRVCNEFEVLFGIVNASLSEDVKKKVAELKQKAIELKKKQLANQKAQEPIKDTQKNPNKNN